jgi:hypothetical protein
MTGRPSLLLLASAIVYFAAALPLLFAPEETLAFAGVAASTFDTALLQVLGSAVFGFAMLNWLNRHSRIGGIFGRPVVAANLAHAGSAALLLGKIAQRAAFAPLLVAVLAVYAVLAIAFAFKFFVQPNAAGAASD